MRKGIMVIIILAVAIFFAATNDNIKGLIGCGPAKVGAVTITELGPFYGPYDFYIEGVAYNQYPKDD